MLVIRIKETGRLVEVEPRFNCGSYTGFCGKDSNNVYSYEEADILSDTEIRAIIDLPEDKIDDNLYDSVKKLRRKLISKYGYESQKTL